MIRPNFTSPDPTSNGHGDPGADPADVDSALGELRDLLFAPEREHLAKIQERLDDPEQRAQELASSLPDAVQLSIVGGRRLSEALAPTVEETLQISVKKDPQALVDALSPVMMPAIRRSIADTIKAMVQALNETLERSFSAQGLRWRLEALRTGRPFAEVVMLRSLSFRVDQVYLIHRKTGLLLHHEAQSGLGVENPDLVSGMLTAIQDFVRDSFGARDTETLDSLEVGEHTVWLETGPHALLAAVMRGSAPRSIRSELQAALTQIHNDYRDALSRFAGDDAAFATSGPILRGCLLEARNESTRKRSGVFSTPLLAASSVAVLIASLWLVSSWREAQRISDLRSRLDATPGVVILDIDEGKGKYVVRGLRDPYAARVEDAVIAAGLDPSDFRIEMQPFASLDPGLTLARAQTTLTPPPSVELTLDQATLAARGAATHAWIEKARWLAPAIPYVDVLDASGVVNLDLEELHSRARRIENTVIDGLPLLAPEGIEFDTPRPVADPRIESLLSSLVDLAVAASQIDLRTTVRVTVVRNGVDALLTQRWTGELKRLLRLREEVAPGLDVRGAVRAHAVAATGAEGSRLVVSLSFAETRAVRVDRP